MRKYPPSEFVVSHNDESCAEVPPMWVFCDGELSFPLPELFPVLALGIKYLLFQRGYLRSAGEECWWKCNSFGIVPFTGAVNGVS